MNNKILLSFVTYMSVLTQVSYGQTTLEEQQMMQQQQQAAMQNPAQHELQRKVLMTQQISEDWLKKVDAGDYAGSWSTGALFLQLTFTEGEWTELLSILRKPLGAVKERTLEDMRMATNPPNTPAGDYMVLLYQTKFSNGQAAKELLTLQEHQGTWKVYTYLIAPDKQGNPLQRQ